MCVVVFIACLLGHAIYWKKKKKNPAQNLNVIRNNRKRKSVHVNQRFLWARQSAYCSEIPF